ncbi:cell growth regulator with EF hand domain protein 1 isoform X2 [Hyperolius riggenbachi]|uniref:cell growth regulator with EF hand domain protein 1 isoform X2 n=1 Tax=Hyperolius riggenbachi TaxID=752182 RepID=UPI0035A38DB2
MMDLFLLLVSVLFEAGLGAPRSGESFLQEYLQEEDPLEEKTSDLKRETVILRLFLLHDFDKSGLLDGLELMRLLSGVLAKILLKEPAEDSVVSLVDEILVKQDVNQDGLLSAQELVTPPASTAEEIPSLHVALPVPPGAQPAASALEDPMDIKAEIPEASEKMTEAEGNDKDPINEAIPPSADVETDNEGPGVVNHEDLSVEKAEEEEEPSEDDVDKQEIQEEIVADNDM